MFDSEYSTQGGQNRFQSTATMKHWKNEKNPRPFRTAKTVTFLLW